MSLVLSIHSATLCLLIGELSPFTFEVIFDRYILTPILIIIFWLFCCYSVPFSLALFCDLMVFCSGILRFLSLFFLFLKHKFIYLFLAALGLCCCVWAFSSCGERGLLFVVVCRLLVEVASLVVEHRL